MTNTAQLRLEHVSLVAPRGHYSLLKSITFDVVQGDRIALVGASGSGKTSLLRLLNRLSDPTQGQIYLENQEIRQIPVLQLRNRVVLVQQESKLLGMTVRESLAYPLTLRRMATKTIQQRMGEWIDRLNLPSEWLDRTETQLSVGQRQWVAIARALVIQPQILLLDEPTSALDTGRSHHLLTVLVNLAKTQGITILMANHQLELAEQFCNRVLHLQHGSLIQDGLATDVDWQDLKQSLRHIEAREAEEWA